MDERSWFLVATRVTGYAELDLRAYRPGKVCESTRCGGNRLTSRGTSEELYTVFYRIHIKQMTGRRTTADPVETGASAARAPTAAEGGLGSITRRWKSTPPL